MACGEGPAGTRTQSTPDKQARTASERRTHLRWRSSTWHIRVTTLSCLVVETAPVRAVSTLGSRSGAGLGACPQRDPRRQVRTRATNRLNSVSTMMTSRDICDIAPNEGEHGTFDCPASGATRLKASRTKGGMAHIHHVQVDEGLNENPRGRRVAREITSDKAQSEPKRSHGIRG